MLAKYQGKKYSPFSPLTMATPGHNEQNGFVSVDVAHRYQTTQHAAARTSTAHTGSGTGNGNGNANQRVNY